MSRIAIITGASSGIGREFARQLDGEGLDELWLIARREERMQQLADELSTTCRIFPLDLRSRAEIEQLRSHLEQARPSVHWLINNAGFGKTGDFAAIALDDQLDMVDLNCRAVVHLSHMAFPWLAFGCRMVTVSSSAGFAPLGGITVYSSTKAFATFFTIGVTPELRRHGIHCTAVCPGPVDTEFHQISRAGSNRKKAIMNEPAPVDEVVALAIRDARKGRALSMYSRGIRSYFVMARLLPMRWIAQMAYSAVYRKR
jgi:hypothetical protein